MTFPPEPVGSPRRAAVVGTGLIGASIGLALRSRGWYVTGRDRDPMRAEAARARGALDAVGEDPDAQVTFVATPVGAVAAEARSALKGRGAVTDVGGVKSSIVAGVDHPRFVGGHPMAGSEQDGVEGAGAELFSGAAWVLTPVTGTDSAAHSLVRSVVTSFGAEVVELAPEDHDAMVAVVSHVPHLAAAALMSLAAEQSKAHGALLRLAAGGFRDMTRVAGGSPGIWLDVCGENAAAITERLSALEQALAAMRERVGSGDRDGLLDALERARTARALLPGSIAEPGAMAELRVPVPDRPGVLADITTLASELGVNIEDLEIAHSSEGDAGVVILLVRSASVVRLADALAQRGYHPSHRSVG